MYKLTHEQLIEVIRRYRDVDQAASLEADNDEQARRFAHSATMLHQVLEQAEAKRNKVPQLDA